MFLDTAFAIALSNDSDDLHQKAIGLADRIQAEKVIIVTTQPVIFEIGNALSKLRYRQAAAKLLDSLVNDTNIEIVFLTEELYSRCFGLFQLRLDKEWSLTDCLSFVILKERGITDALTTDHHFIQAGFQILLPRFGT